MKNIKTLKTHLHHIAGECSKRQAQVKPLLIVLKVYDRIIIFGDFNAETGDPEIQMMTDAGLIY